MGAGLFGLFGIICLGEEMGEVALFGGSGVWGDGFRGLFFGETKAEFQVPADEISGNIRGWDPLENSFVIESFGRICFDED